MPSTLSLGCIWLLNVCKMSNEQNVASSEENEETKSESQSSENISESIQISGNMVGVFHILNKSKMFSAEIWILFKGK